MKTKYLILIFLIVLNLISCTHEQVKFNQNKWKTRNDIDYNHREFMIEDIRNSYLKKGMKLTEVESLLGKSQYESDSDSIMLQYEIYTNYGWDIDPIETKTFILNFNADSTLINTHIDNWKN